MAPSPDSSPRKRNKFVVATLLLLVAGFLVCTAEAVARRLRPDLTHAGLRAHIESRRYTWSRPDADFHHIGDGAFALNFPREGSGEADRVLVLGDSFAMGHGVGEERRFATIAGQLLGRVEEVDVMATSGYSPIVYRSILRRALDSGRYATVAVFVDQTDPADDLLYRNDLVSPDAHQFDLALMNARRSEVEGSYELMLRELSGLRGILRRSVFVNVSMPLTIAEYFPTESVHWRYVQTSRTAPLLTHAFQAQPDAEPAVTMERVLLDHLDEIVELCRAHQVRLLFAANPWEFHVSPAPRVEGGHTAPFPKQNRLEAVLHARYGATEDVEVLELTEAMRAAPDPSALFLDDPPNEVHWNARGHSRVGRILAQRLASGQQTDVRPQLTSRSISSRAASSSLVKKRPSS